MTTRTEFTIPELQALDERLRCLNKEIQAVANADDKPLIDAISILRNFIDETWKNRGFRRS